MWVKYSKGTYIYIYIYTVRPTTVCMYVSICIDLTRSEINLFPPSHLNPFIGFVGEK